MSQSKDLENISRINYYFYREYILLNCFQTPLSFTELFYEKKVHLTLSRVGIFMHTYVQYISNGSIDFPESVKILA